ncbi:MAG: copper chaperone PCu(A)C [Burkholderiales bacterium]|nr:copper chaperone PCu(A)C [Burkholderiales bacterium]
MSRVVGLLSSFIGMFVGAAFAGEVIVSEAWTRASAPAQKVAGVYFNIQSNIDARLVGVRTELTEVAEIHLMSVEDGVMRMRAVEAVELPTGKTVAFQPGGYHVMLFDLPRLLKPGEQFTLELLVDDEAGQRSTLTVSVRVRNLDGSEVQNRRH